MTYPDDLADTLQNLIDEFRSYQAQFASARAGGVKANAAFNAMLQALTDPVTAANTQSPLYPVEYDVWGLKPSDPQRDTAKERLTTVCEQIVDFCLFVSTMDMEMYRLTITPVLESNQT